MTTEQVHTCSYYCDRKECLKAQRDELRDRLEGLDAEKGGEVKCWRHRPGQPCPMPDSCLVNGCSAVERELLATPPAQSAEAVAEAMGAKGAPPSEPERLAFEAWMRGHCWALCATWDGKGYKSDAEQGGGYCPHASMTRRLWAAWRDRAAIAAMQAGE